MLTNVQGNSIKFDFSFEGAHGISPFGTTAAPGRYSQHLLATADVGAGGVALPTWQNGVGAIYTLFSAFPCDSGLGNQPPIFVSSPTARDDSGIPSVFVCFGRQKQFLNRKRNWFKEKVRMAHFC